MPDNRPEMFAIWMENQWYAWACDEHLKKYRGRTLMEAVGKLLIARLMPETMSLTAVGPTGKFVVPSPVPTLFIPDELKPVKVPYKLT